MTSPRGSSWLSSLTSLERWSSYKYRFLPWLIFNLKKEADRQDARRIREIQHDPAELLADVLASLEHFQEADFRWVFRNDDRRRRHFANLHRHNSLQMERAMGFSLQVGPSSLGPKVGRGVFVAPGVRDIPKGKVVALYPGTVYEAGQPILLQSVANQYILRCVDGVSIDGKSGGLSGVVFSSLHARERAHPMKPLCDVSWTVDPTAPVNPLSVGQIINNAGEKAQANVSYAECDVDVTLDYRLRSLLPNIQYDSATSFGGGGRNRLRIAPLVALKDIKPGEELFSSYFSYVKT